MSWRDVLKTSWIRLEEVWKTRIEDLLKTCAEDVLKKFLEDVLKTLWRKTKCLLGTSASSKSKCVSNKSIFLYFYSGTIYSFCLCKSTTWFLRKQSIDSIWVILNNWWIKNTSDLLQTAPLTITCCILPFKILKILNFLLSTKISYFLFFMKFVNENHELKC